MSERFSPERRGRALIVAAWLGAVLLWMSPGITRPDGVGYIAWLASAVVDHDLSFYDEWQRSGLVNPDGRIFHEQVTSTGLLGNHWPAGSATWWMPAYLAADIGTRTAGMRGDGFTVWHLRSAMIASALAGLFALLLSLGLARRQGGESNARLATLGVWFGSPLLFYAIRSPLTSHAVAAMACAAAVWCAVGLRDHLRDPAREGAVFGPAFAFGLAAGFAFAVRPQNAPFALIPLLLFDRNSWRAALRSKGRLALAACAGGLAGALPQLVASAAIYGNPFGSLQLGGGEGRAFAAFERVWFTEPFFSWYHGMLPWTPVLGLALVGLVALWRKDPGLGRAGLFCLATQCAINASFDRYFWGGYAFGQRRFDNCTVFFVLGLAALLALLPRRVGALAVTACCAWTTLLLLAAPRFDLNRYQPPSVLVRAMLDTLADPASWLRPLSAVPDGSRASFLACLVAGCLAAGALAWAFSRARPGLALPLASGLACAWLLLAAGLFAFAGTRSQEGAQKYAGLIAHNQSMGLQVGAVEARLGLLAEEVFWLDLMGRGVEAARTRAEIKEIERCCLPVRSL